MTDKYALESNLSPLLRKMFALLAELDGSRQGEVFRDHIKQTLVEWEANQTKTINTYVSLVNLLLDAFASQLPPDSVALSHLKLIQTCLTPPLSDAELVALQQNVEEAADILRHSCLINIDELNESLMPMLKRVTGMPGDKEEVHFPQPTSKEIKKGYEDALDEEQQNVEAESEFSGKNVSIQETANELEKNLAPELTPEKGFAKPKLVESATLDSDFDLDTNQSIQDQEFSDVENDGEQQNIFDELTDAYPELRLQGCGLLINRGPYFHPDSYVDLVFTNGVLFHILPDKLKQIMSKINRVSKKYILCSEYFSP